MGITVSVSGDSIINRRVSVCEDEGFRSLIEQFQAADIGFTHLEVNLLDYDDPNVYPAAEAGGTWMRAPPAMADELVWAGFDVVSHSSNHALDYGYGGLESTWSALDGAGVAHAGTGKNLADARRPTYRETAGGRVACVSMTTSFTRWSRAGEARRDMQGRPGTNPLGYHYEVGPEMLEMVTGLATAMGMWITRTDDGEWLLNPPGIHNTIYRFVESDEPGVRPVLDGADREGNLQAIEEGARQSDVTIAHIHTHEWDTNGDMSDPAPFLPAFTRDCVDAGADIVVCQGSHTPLRGIDQYEGGVIFHDPGDFFMMSDTTELLPSEFYDRYGGDLDGHPADAMPGELLEARGVSSMFDEDDEDDSDYGGGASNPPGGYFSGDVLGNFVGVCSFDDAYELEAVELHPGVLQAEPTLYKGVSKRATGERAREIIEHVDELSDRFGTDVEFDDGIGRVVL